VIDPISAYVGSINDNRNAELRGLLAPLAELAAKHDVAVVCVTHMNKSEVKKVIYRATGSLAYVAAARAVWLVAEDRKNADRRWILPVKMNLAARPTALAYRIVDGVVEWEREPFNMTADELMAGEPRGASKLDEAEGFLRETLCNGPIASGELARLAEDAGISERTLERARKRLGVVSAKATGDTHGDWLVSLPSSPNGKSEKVGGLGGVGGDERPQDRQDRQGGHGELAAATPCPEAAHRDAGRPIPLEAAQEGQNRPRFDASPPWGTSGRGRTERGDSATGWTRACGTRAKGKKNGGAN
jgi:hypothetical protein